MIVLLVLIGIMFFSGVLYLSVPSAESAPLKENAPAKIVLKEDGSMPEIILTPKAAERIGIETGEVERSDEKYNTN